MTDTSNKTFVYEGKEWTLTGRTATKPIYHKRKLNLKVGTMTLVEIAPDGPMSSDPSFFKWVDPRELFYISEMKDLDVEKIKNENKKADADENN